VGDRAGLLECEIWAVGGHQRRGREGVGESNPATHLERKKLAQKRGRRHLWVCKQCLCLWVGCGSLGVRCACCGAILPGRKRAGHHECEESPTLGARPSR